MNNQFDLSKPWPRNRYTAPDYVIQIGNATHEAAGYIVEILANGTDEAKRELFNGKTDDVQRLETVAAEWAIGNILPEVQRYNSARSTEDKATSWQAIIFNAYILRPYVESILNGNVLTEEAITFLYSVMSAKRSSLQSMADALNIAQAAQRVKFDVPTDSENAATLFYLTLSKTDKEEICAKYGLAKLDSAEDLAQLSIETINKIRKGYQPKFYKISNSEQTNLIETTLAGGIENITTWPKAIKERSHGKADFKAAITTGGTLKLEKTTDKNKTAIEIDNFEAVTRSNKSVKKFFDLCIAAVNDQLRYYDFSVTSGKFTDISIPLQDLVDSGMYTDIRAARRGAYNAGKTLTGLRLAYVTDGHKSAGVSVLFPEVKIKDNVAYIAVNLSDVWNGIFKYITYTAEWALALSSRGYDLYRLIATRARQNGKKLNEAGYIDIPMRVIQNALFLPNENETKNPGSHIKDPIEAAITDIEEKANTGNIKFELLPSGIEDKRIKEFLDCGYLRVYITGAYAERFTAQAIRRDKILASKQRKERKAKPE